MIAPVLISFNLFLYPHHRFLAVSMGASYSLTILSIKRTRGKDFLAGTMMRVDCFCSIHVLSRAHRSSGWMYGEKNASYFPPTLQQQFCEIRRLGLSMKHYLGRRNWSRYGGELSRVFQHEFDHDRGILLLDHISLDEMDSRMRNIETKGHDERTILAFSRFLSEPRVRTGSDFVTTIKDIIVEPTNAIENIPMDRERSDVNLNSMIDDKISTNESNILVCDEACKVERKRIIEGRRAMMNQSRSTSQRSEVLELSRQRAKLYGTDFKGVSCPPGIPCI